MLAPLETTTSQKHVKQKTNLKPGKELREIPDCHCAQTLKLDFRRLTERRLCGLQRTWAACNKFTTLWTCNRTNPKAKTLKATRNPPKAGRQSQKATRKRTESGGMH
jgi:hypothetical protein